MPALQLKATKTAALKKPTLTLVKGDKKSHVINFIVPRYQGGVDLSQLGWDVAIRNEQEQTEMQPLQVVQITEQDITAKWLIRGIVTKIPGKTYFELQGRGQDEYGDILWQSGMRFIQVTDDIEAQIEGTEQQKTQINVLINNLSLILPLLQRGVQAKIDQLGQIQDKLQQQQEDVDTTLQRIHEYEGSMQEYYNNTARIAGRVQDTNFTINQKYNQINSTYNVVRDIGDNMNIRMFELTNMADNVNAKHADVQRNAELVESYKTEAVNVLNRTLQQQARLFSTISEVGKTMNDITATQQSVQANMQQMYNRINITASNVGDSTILLRESQQLMASTIEKSNYIDAKMPAAIEALDVAVAKGNQVLANAQTTRQTISDIKNEALTAKAQMYTILETMDRLQSSVVGATSSKQDKLIAGDGISIANDGKTISATCVYYDEDDVIICGNKKIVFNDDGTVTWENI